MCFIIHLSIELEKKNLFCYGENEWDFDFHNPTVALYNQKPLKHSTKIMKISLCNKSMHEQNINAAWINLPNTHTHTDWPMRSGKSPWFQMLKLKSRCVWSCCRSGEFFSYVICSVNSWTATSTLTSTRNAGSCTHTHTPTVNEDIQIETLRDQRKENYGYLLQQSS